MQRTNCIQRSFSYIGDVFSNRPLFYMISRVIIDSNVLGLGDLFNENGLFRHFHDKGSPLDVSKMAIFALLTK